MGSKYVHQQISCNFELHLGRLFNFKCQVLGEVSQNWFISKYKSKIYQLKESALVQFFRIFLRSFIRFSFLALAIATDVQLYLYALSNEQFIRRAISQIISGYRNYQKIRNNKRVLNNTLQHTIRHDIKWKTLTLSCNCPLVTSFLIY